MFIVALKIGIMNQYIVLIPFWHGWPDSHHRGHPHEGRGQGAHHQGQVHHGTRTKWTFYATNFGFWNYSERKKPMQNSWLAKKGLKRSERVVLLSKSILCFSTILKWSIPILSKTTTEQFFSFLRRYHEQNKQQKCWIYSYRFYRPKD